MAQKFLTFRRKHALASRIRQYAKHVIGQKNKTLLLVLLEWSSLNDVVTHGFLYDNYAAPCTKTTNRAETARSSRRMTAVKI